MCQISLEKYSENGIYIITGTKNSQKAYLFEKVMDALRKKGVAAGIFERVPMHTTKPGDKEGFISVSKDTFEVMKNGSEFLEYNCKLSIWYGLSLQALQDVLKKERHAVLFMSLDAALVLRATLGKSVHITYYKGDTDRLCQKHRNLMDSVFGWRKEGMHVDYIAAAIFDNALSRKPYRVYSVAA